MSHYVVLVIGDNPDAQLAPFDENIDVPPYRDGEITEADKEYMLKYYRENRGLTYDSWEECYKANGREWDGNMTKKRGNTWYRYSTYNPNSKWDWYVLGGRWSGRFIVLKDGCAGTIGGSGVYNNQTGVDAALKKDIDWEKIDRKNFIPYAVLYEGEWISRGDMGWWGMTIEEHFSESDWENKVWEIIEELPGDTLLSFYDLHI